MKQFKFFAAGLAVLSLTACGENENYSGGTAPVKVVTAKAGVPLSGQSYSYSGTVEGSQDAVLSFQVAGTVKNVNTEVGQRVGKGELLASIDHATYKSSYDAAVAALVQARDAYNRMKELRDKKSLAEIKWVEAENQLQQAASLEEIARYNLEHCNLYSPFNGVISEKNIEIGQNAVPGMQVFKITAIGQVKVKISVPEQEISKIKMNGKACVEVAALDGRRYEGTVVEKGVEAHPLSHSYDVKIAVDNSDRMLMPGMVTKVELQQTDTAAVVTLPAHLVQLDEDNKSFVWIVKNGKAERRDVVCGNYTASGVEIAAGLDGSEEIIVEGQQKVCNGTPVATK